MPNAIGIGLIRRESCELEMFLLETVWFENVCGSAERSEDVEILNRGVSKCNPLVCDRVLVWRHFPYLPRR